MKLVVIVAVGMLLRFRQAAAARTKALAVARDVVNNLKVAAHNVK